MEATEGGPYPKKRKLNVVTAESHSQQQLEIVTIDQATFVTKLSNFVKNAENIVYVTKISKPSCYRHTEHTQKYERVWFSKNCVSFLQPQETVSSQQETESDHLKTGLSQQQAKPSQQQAGPSQQQTESSQQHPGPCQQWPRTSHQNIGPSQQQPGPSQQQPGPSQQQPEPSQEQPGPSCCISQGLSSPCDQSRSPQVSESESDDSADLDIHASHQVLVNMDMEEYCIIENYENIFQLLKNDFEQLPQEDINRWHMLAKCVTYVEGKTHLLPQQTSQPYKTESKEDYAKFMHLLNAFGNGMKNWDGRFLASDILSSINNTLPPSEGIYIIPRTGYPVKELTERDLIQDAVKHKSRCGIRQSGRRTRGKACSSTSSSYDEHCSGSQTSSVVYPDLIAFVYKGDGTSIKIKHGVIIDIKSYHRKQKYAEDSKQLFKQMLGALHLEKEIFGVLLYVDRALFHHMEKVSQTKEVRHSRKEVLFFDIDKYENIYYMNADKMEKFHLLMLSVLKYSLLND